MATTTQPTTPDTRAAKIAAVQSKNAEAQAAARTAAAADSSFPGVIEWFQKTGAAAATFDLTVAVHLRSVTKQLADMNFLAQQTIANVTSAQALGGSGTGGGSQWLHARREFTARRVIHA